MRLSNYIKEEIEYKIYCDLDGVLVDFLQGMSDKIDPNIKDGWKKWITKKKSEDVWTKVAEMGATFWSELPWTSDGKQLWNYIKKYEPTILTARPKTVTSAIKGKRDWISKELGSGFLKTAFITLSIEKQNHASKSSVLIDDSKRNIKQWRSKGGIGILHKNTSDTIKKLKDLWDI